MEQPNTPLGMLFNLLTKKYYGALTKMLHDLELEKHFFVLYLVVKHEKITQQGLADCIHVDKATMVRMIDYLTEKGMVKREQCAKDRRSYYIVPTAKAIKTLPQIEQTYQHVNKAAFKGVSKAEQKLFTDVLQKIMSNLEELPAEKVEVRFIKK